MRFPVTIAARAESRSKHGRELGAVLVGACRRDPRF